MLVQAKPATLQQFNSKNNSNINSSNNSRNTNNRNNGIMAFIVAVIILCTCSD